MGYTRKFRLILAALGFVVLAAVAGVFLLLRPRTVWLVDAAYRERWERILDTAEPPRRARIVAEEESRRVRRNWRGFVISARGPREREAGETEDTEGPDVRPLVLYHGLAASRSYGGALLLALDPWMMFRDFKDPAVSRERVDSPGGGEGVLVMPGRDQDSRWAWAAQLLQRQTGIFPEEKEAWQAVMEGLFWDNRRFQPGAETYGWLDAMPLLYRSSPAWIYAPLSRIRLQSPLESGGLEANRYPDADDWHEFGIQATMLWAMPFGGETKATEDLRLWLEDPKTQTAIANVLGWIPAHPSGTPYDTVSRSARLAYLSSSFVWTFD